MCECTGYSQFNFIDSVKKPINHIRSYDHRTLWASSADKVPGSSSDFGMVFVPLLRGGRKVNDRMSKSKTTERSLDFFGNTIVNRSCPLALLILSWRDGSKGE